MAAGPQRYFAGGGPKKPKLPADCTHFDVLAVGGLNATALVKFMQTDDVNYKMGVIADRSRFVIPENYFAVSHGHAAALKLESATVSSQVEPWSRFDVGVKVSQFHPEENRVVLDNGKEYTYKSLVIATGFDHGVHNLEGLGDFESDRGENQVFVHAIDTKHRLQRNYYHGWFHQHGDMVYYLPKLPYKGEGTDFYGLYYEQFLRYHKLQGRSAANARIEVWTPNDRIYEFDYANEFVLEECRKRDIQVHFGWEMTKVFTNQVGEKIALMRNEKTGETFEKNFNSLIANPPSKPHQNLIDGGLTDAAGLVDVNPYTLQHKKYANVFAFGDCTNVNTTRTQSAAQMQNPVVKHNVKQFLEGGELNAIYDGYSFLPLYVGSSYATSFSHLHNFEPHWKNHMVPTYGAFSRFYFGRMLKSYQGMAENYNSFKKNHGPPHWHYNPRHLPLEHNEYLLKNNIELDRVRMFEPKRQLETAALSQ